MSVPDIERRATAGVAVNGRRLVGYAALFGVETRIGGFTERIAPGAFAESLSQSRDILALLDHKPDVLLGRTKSGTLSLREDQKGLHFELQVPDTQAGRDLIALAERGDLGGMSFGFIAKDEQWEGNTRELRAVELHEVSVVQSWPAYSQTEISLRNKPATCEADVNRLWLDTL